VKYICKKLTTIDSKRVGKQNVGILLTKNAVNDHSVRYVCFSLLVSCRWSVLHVIKISLSNIPTLSLLLFIFKNSAIILRKLYFLKLVQVLNQSLVSTAKWHVASPVYR